MKSNPKHDRMLIVEVTYGHGLAFVAKRISEMPRAYCTREMRSGSWKHYYDLKRHLELEGSELCHSLWQDITSLQNQRVALDGNEQMHELISQKTVSEEKKKK